MTNFKTIYIRKGREETYDKLVKCLNREGRSIGEFLVEQGEKYLSVHGEGNPQAMLDFADQPRTLPKWKTCKCSSGRLIKGEFRCQGLHDSRKYYKTPDRCNGCDDYRERKGKGGD